RLDAYLQDGEPLPDETVNYIASVAPRLGGGPAMSGPLSAYADTGSGIPVAVAAAAPPPAAVAAGTCDADIAYDPSRPCAAYVAPAAPVDAAPVPAAEPVVMAAAACDPDAAYDPSQPCQPAPASAADANSAPVQVIQAASVVPAAAAPPPPLVLSLPSRRSGGARGFWGIQVGAFRTLELARQTAGGARTSLPDLLGNAAVRIEATTPFGSTVLYRARVVGVSAQTAAAACARLRGEGAGCLVVAPGPI
ncbi:MAG TPA: SPOR domain-containing protein, partial [Acetobacteraceae bacterium]|nr:SPOR domain-containing protein [Acetobacteraceae bacterium]